MWNSFERLWSRRPVLRGVRSWGCSLLLASVVGCAPPSTVEIVPVTGSVSCDGTPAAHALVVLHPKSDDPEMQKLRPYAWSDAEGNFSLSTQSDGDGAPLGEYHVTVEWRAAAQSASNDPEANRSGPDRLAGRYRDPNQSGLTVSVQRNTPLQIQVTLARK